MSSVSKTDDRRVAIDITIVKQSCGLVTRWCPTELMLADGQTNGQMDPADLLRSALHVGEYQLRAEANVLDQKRRMRDERDRRKFSAARGETTRKRLAIQCTNPSHQHKHKDKKKYRG